MPPEFHVPRKPQLSLTHEYDHNLAGSSRTRHRFAVTAACRGQYNTVDFGCADGGPFAEREEEQRPVIPESIFREYDIRGVVGDEITADTAKWIGMGLGRYFLDHGARTVVVGRDNRPSSPWIRNALVEGLVATGCDVIDIGIAITPMVYWSTHVKGTGAGVMITASHNPSNHNGFKIVCGESTIYGPEIAKVRDYARREMACACTGPHAGQDDRPVEKGKVWHEDISDRYLDMIASKVTLRSVNGSRPLKVAVDCGHGTASRFARALFTKLGCEVYEIFCESCGTFPAHDPDPARAVNMRWLSQAVRESAADVGIGFDGDGDRLGVVDEKGEYVHADRIMVLFWREVLSKHPGTTALIEVKCSQALYDEVSRLGGKPQWCRTGHSLIKARMRELGVPFAGEMSGHMFFADEYYGFDDAFYAAARLLRILSGAEMLTGAQAPNGTTGVRSQRATLSQILETVPKYPSTGETRIPCPDEHKFRVVEDLVRRLKPIHEVVDVDGVRVIFEDGWGLVRASNTQPVLVARCEGETREALRKITTYMESLLREYPQVGEFEWEP